MPAESQDCKVTNSYLFAGFANSKHTQTHIMEFTHKVQKYALIHCAAGEILAHMDELQTCSDSNSYFHVLQIEKAALFIQFVEDIYIIPGTETIQDSAIKDMWNNIQCPKFTYSVAGMAPMWNPILIKLKEYQNKINGKFLNVTAPF